MGTIFRIKETTILDIIRTNVKAIPIPKAFSNFVVTANAGHNPNNENNIGFSLTIPFVKVNGIMVAYKGQAYNEEIENAKLAFEKLKSKVIYIHKYELINELGSRYLIEIKKNEKTNIKYPRRFAEIKKKPL